MKALWIGCVLWVLPWGSWAEAGMPESFSFRHDNDVIFNSDRDYSSGLFLSIANVGGLKHVAQAFTDGLFGKGSGHGSSFGLSLGQEMYTPLDTILEDFLPFERPFAGWLYVAGEYRVRTARWGLRAWLRLGIVGPASLAQGLQQLWHAALRTFSTETAKGGGWDYQLPHEFTLQTLATWELYVFQLQHGSQRWMDLTLMAELAVGNVWVHPELRVLWRIGWLPHGERSAQVPTFWSKKAEALSPRKWHFFFFAEGFLRLVVRNLFLDGSTFFASHRIERYPAVGGAELGLDWRAGNFRMRLGIVLQTLDAPYALRGYTDHKYFRLTLGWEK